MKTKFLGFLLFLLPLFAYGEEVVPPRSDPAHPLQQAHYPQKFRITDRDGRALLRLFVDSEGRVVNATLVESTGYPELDREALKVALTWRLRPGTIDGRPTAMQRNFAVGFVIKKPK